MLEDRIDYYKKFGKMLNNTPAQYKNDFPWLKEVDSYSLANAQMNLKKAFSAFFKNPSEKGLPKFKSKKRDVSTYTTNNINNCIRLENSSIRLPKIGLVKIKLHRSLPQGGNIKSATIRKTKSGKYYISIFVEYEYQIPTLQLNPNKAIGLDYNSSCFYVDSQGNKANYPKFYRIYQDKLVKEQRKLSNMVLDSNNFQKQRLKISKIYEKISNCRYDWFHKLSLLLANNWDYVVIESLNMKEISQLLRLGKSTMDNSFNSFKYLLQYKLQLRGKQLIIIDKWTPTSTVCSCCGAYHKDIVNSLDVRKWVCPDCGASHDRDINAAINIKNIGLNNLLSRQELPVEPVDTCNISLH